MQNSHLYPELYKVDIPVPTAPCENGKIGSGTLIVTIGLVPNCPCMYGEKKMSPPWSLLVQSYEEKMICWTGEKKSAMQKTFNVGSDATADWSFMQHHPTKGPQVTHTTNKGPQPLYVSDFIKFVHTCDCGELTFTRPLVYAWKEGQLVWVSKINAIGNSSASSKNSPWSPESCSHPRLRWTDV